MMVSYSNTTHHNNLENLEMNLHHHENLIYCKTYSKSHSLKVSNRWQHNKLISKKKKNIQTGSGACPASYPMGTGGSFPGGKVAGGMKLNIHLHIVLRLRMCGAIPPLPNTSL
jgi:hypothetical protein